MKNLICFFASICCFFLVSNRTAYGQEEAHIFLSAQDGDFELLVRTINTLGKESDNPLRLRGIAQKFHADWPDLIGLIGMQEAKGGMTGCKVSRSHGDAARCLAGELSSLFGSEASGRHTGGTSDTENGIVVDSNWKLVESQKWGIHSSFLGLAPGARKLLMVLVEHKTKGFRLRFYSVHFTPNPREKDENAIEERKKERGYQAKKVVEIVSDQAKTGELPPIVVGDFNAGRDFVTGEAEKSVKIMEKYFWRPIDSYRRSDETGTGIDIIYIGKKESFPYSNGDFEPIARHHIPMRGIPVTVDGIPLKQLTDHHSEGFRLKIKNASPLPRIVWWEDKDFKGTRHTRTLHPRDHGKCLALEHNDAMKSIKFYGLPGWKLYIYDSGNCKGNDDWGVLTFPNDPNVVVVEVPKIGRQGPNECSPPGSYEFHEKNGLAGKVSAIKHTDS